MFLFEIKLRLTELPPEHEEGSFHWVTVEELQKLPLPGTDREKIWPLFFVIGWGFIIWSLFTEEIFFSIFLGVFGFSSLWSIGELIEQEKRVEKGWFPKNPNKKD